jgi:hypothetical protein
MDPRIRIHILKFQNGSAGLLDGEPGGGPGAGVVQHGGHPLHPAQPPARPGRQDGRDRRRSLRKSARYVESLRRIYILGIGYIRIISSSIFQFQVLGNRARFVYSLRRIYVSFAGWAQYRV